MNELEDLSKKLDREIERDEIVFVKEKRKVSVEELIKILQEIEKVAPDLEVALYDTEFMNTQPIRRVSIANDVYNGIDGLPDRRETTLVLS